MQQDYDTCWTDNAICPHCGCEHENSWELGLKGDGDEMNYVCDSCGMQFRIVMCVEVTYSTTKLGET
jgi:uncharacterized Zn finger protein